MDDIASGSGSCSGWVYFLLPSDGDQWFCRKFNAAKRKGCQSGFHGTEYTTPQRPAYEALLQLIRETAECTPQSRCVLELHPKQHRDKLAKDAQAIIVRKAKAIGLTKVSGGSKVIGEAGRVAQPIRMLLQHADWLGPDLTMEIQLDASGKLHINSSLRATLNGKDYGPLDVVAAGFNSAAEELSTRIPRLAGGILSAIKDEDSPLVQSADVFGNFAMAHVRSRLGSTAGGTLEKAAVFAAAFDGLLPSAQVAADLSLSSSGDLNITPGSALSVSAGAVITKMGVPPTTNA